MLEAIGCRSVDDPFAQVPEEMRLDHLDLPDGKSELEVRRILEGIAAKNTVFPSVFRGGGGLPALHPRHRQERHQQGDLPHRLHPLPGRALPGGAPVHL